MRGWALRRSIWYWRLTCFARWWFSCSVAMLLLVLTGCGGTPGSSSRPPSLQPKSGTGNWVTVAALSGSADKQGPVFALSGAPAQLTCKVVSTSGAPRLSVYTLLAGKSLADSQGTALGSPGDDDRGRDKEHHLRPARQQLLPLRDLCQL